MPLRNFIAKFALTDARRFEVEALQELKDIHAECPETKTRAVLERIIREEEEHVAHMDEELAKLRGKPVEEPDEKPALPEAPRREPLKGTTLQKLQRLAKKEEASATFYRLLSERTPIPAVRKIFRHLAEEECGHFDALAEHVRELQGKAEK